MNRIYEELFIVKPDVLDEEVDAYVEQLRTQLTAAGATVDKVDKWGKRKLAYRIDKYREGTYVLFQFTGPADIVREFERRLRVSDQVLKFLTVRIDETLKRLEKRKGERDKRAAKRAANEQYFAIIDNWQASDALPFDSSDETGTENHTPDVDGHNIRRHGIHWK